MRWRMNAARNRLLSLAVLLALVPWPVLAQSPDRALPDASYPASPPACPGHSASLYPDWEAPRTPAWEIYVKAGPVVPVGVSFSEHFHTGGTVQGGVQLPILSLGPQAALRFFGEVGGEYTAMTGDKSPEETAIIFNSRQEDHTHTINDFFLTEIRELRQGGVHGDLGWSYDPAALTRSEPGRLHIEGRMGFRTGRLEAAFQQTATPAGLQILQATEAAHIAQGLNPSLFQLLNEVKNTGTFFGLFWSLGVSVTYPDVRLGRFPLGDFTVGAEVRFTHDWIDGFGDFKQHDTVLETITPLLTLEYSF